MDLNQNQLITILEAMDCFKGEMSTTPEEYNSIIEEVNKELHDKFNYETNLYKNECGDYVISIYDFGRDHEEVEKERHAREMERYKIANHLQSLLDLSKILQGLINGYIFNNLMYNQITDSAKQKVKEVLDYVKESVISILPTDIGFYIDCNFDNQQITVGLDFYYKDDIRPITYLSCEEKDSIYIKDYNMTLLGISKYLENSRI